MTTTHLLLSAWDFQPSVVLGCVGLVVVYVFARLTPLFLAGVAVLFLALVSPLDTLGDTYLFSAHMAQHMLLVLVVPPLLLLGVPPHQWERLLAFPPADHLEHILGRPVIAWPVGVVTLWAWHAPALYNAALAGEDVHVFQHLTFLVASTIFWWPVIAPLPKRRQLPAWAALAYLMLAALSNSALGIILTFSPASVYPAYLHPVGTPAIDSLIRDQWGLTPDADQRLGGGLMWIAGGLVYLLAVVLTLARWFRDLDEVEDQEEDAVGWRVS